MSHKQRSKPQPLPDNVAAWTISTEMQVHGRYVVPGTELSIQGERGRFRFQRYVLTPNGAAWIDVIGGPRGHSHWRCFRPGRIRTVHRLTRTPRGYMEERQAA